MILPFEQKFYERHGVKAEFVGHPLLDEFAKDAPQDDDFYENHQQFKIGPEIFDCLFL